MNNDNNLHHHLDIILLNSFHCFLRTLLITQRLAMHIEYLKFLFTFPKITIESDKLRRSKARLFAIHLILRQSPLWILQTSEPLP